MQGLQPLLSRKEGIKCFIFHHFVQRLRRWPDGLCGCCLVCLSGSGLGKAFALLCSTDRTELRCFFPSGWGGEGPRF